MKRLIPLFFLFALVLPSYGSHLVGGEFELLHLSGFTYRLNLILYFDVINGNPGARDPNALARIFRKSDNAALLDVSIPYISQSPVAYFQPACAHGEVVTLRLLYSTTITLPAEDFNHPDGYYVTWQRCCRNYNIDNIFSEDPNLGGMHAGQTFFLEFPPVVNASGESFINSSPNLFPVLSDLVCPNREYWLDFSGKDADGDSLTYTLVTPLNTFNPFGTPPGGPRPGPYDEVSWRTDLGFGIDNIVNGSPDLQISPTGFLNVRPTQQGLFLFSVKCEEYRDNIKIGELIRDFQMFVLDACPSATAPVITTKTATETTYSDVSSIDIVVPNTAEGANRCIYIQVSDSDAAIAADGFEEKITLRAIGLNFNPEIGELESILPDIRAATLKNGSSQQFEICFPKCPFSNTPSSGIFQIGIIANDDSCPLPLFDQLTLRVRIIPPDNNAPVLLVSDIADATTYNDVSSVDIVVPNTAKDANRCIQIQVSDLDAARAADGFEEKITLKVVSLSSDPKIGELESILPDIRTATLKNGSSDQFEICFPKCPFSNIPSSGIFPIGITAHDDSCPLPLFDQLILRVRIIPPDNNAPVLLVSDIADATTYSDVSSVDIVVPNTAEDANRCIQIQVSDLDAAKAVDGFEEKVTLKVISLNSDPEIGELESILPDIRIATLKNGSSDQFEICFPKCPFSNIPSSGIFQIEIAANDDSCPLPLFDHLTLRVRIIPPDNNAPVLLVSGNEVSKITQNEIPGIKTISIPIQGLDADGHDLMMQINPVGGFDLKRAGMEFTNVPDARFQLGPINTTFNWKIDCTNNSLDFSEGRTVSPEGEEIVKQYKIEMLLKDQGECGSSEEDELDMEFNIRFPSQFEPNVYEVENGENVELLKYQFYLDENINLDIRAKDRGPNPDNIHFIARGSNFNLVDYGAKFEDKIDHSGEVTTPFQWSLDCDKFNLAKIDSFRVHFIVEDNNICNLANRDTLAIDFLIDLVPNTAPRLALTSSKSQIVDSKIIANVGKEISVNVQGTDDTDSLFLKLLPIDGVKNIPEFEPVKGILSVNSTFTWTPDCENLEGLAPASYRFTFALHDKQCAPSLSEELSLEVVVKDIESIHEDFFPPNVFTPNGDDKNSYFGMYKLVNGKRVSILPVDNCSGVFHNIKIFSRWGREVFSSTDYKFKWRAEGLPSGVYFYKIEYSNIAYKGMVSVLF